MTEGQVKYQTLMENQRHNYAMERLGEKEADIHATQAQAALSQADTAAKVAEIRDKELSLAKAKYQVATWQQVGNIGERVYDAVQKIYSNGFGFLGNMINAIRNVAGVSGNAANSKPLFN